MRAERELDAQLPGGSREAEARLQAGPTHSLHPESWRSCLVGGSGHAQWVHRLQEGRPPGAPSARDGPGSTSPVNSREGVFLGWGTLWETWFLEEDISECE